MQVQPHHHSYLQHIKQQMDGNQPQHHHHAQAMAQSVPHHFSTNAQFGVTSPSPLPLILNAPSRAFSGDIDWSSLMSYIDAPTNGAVQSHAESPPSTIHTITPPQHMQTPSPQTAHRNTQWLTLPSPPPASLNNMAQNMNQQQYGTPHPLFAMPQSNAIAAVIPPLPLMPVSIARPHFDSGVVYRKASCEPCYKVKTSCDGRRPCERCVRLERESLCVERIPKVKERKNGKAQNNGAPQLPPHQHGSAEKDKAANEAMKKEKKRRRSGDETKTDSHSVAAEDSKAGKVERESGGVSVDATMEPPPDHEHISSNSSVHSPEVPLTVDDDERRLSVMMLNAFLADPATTDLIRAALSNRKLPNIAMPIFLSYIAHALHPEDFAQLSATIAGPPATAISHAGDPFFLCLPDGRFFPRISYPFGQSPDEAAIDSTIHVNVAMMTISRASSTTPTQAAREKEIAMAVQNMQLLRKLQEKPLTTQSQHVIADAVSTAPNEDDAL